MATKKPDKVVEAIGAVLDAAKAAPPANQPDEDLDADVDFSYALAVAIVADGDTLAIGHLESIED